MIIKMYCSRRLFQLLKARVLDANHASILIKIIQSETDFLNYNKIVIYVLNIEIRAVSHSINAY